MCVYIRCMGFGCSNQGGGRRRGRVRDANVVQDKPGIYGKGGGGV